MMATFCARFLPSLLLVLSCFTSAPASLAASANEPRYVVKKNDTLTAIARKHGVTVAALMAHNRLAQADRIHAGKVLRIPSRSPGREVSPLETELRLKLDRVRVTPKKWKFIVIHHSATETGTVKGMDRYHRDEMHMENGLAYHFVIGNGHGMKDGEITVGRRWSEQLDGGHLRSESLNAKSVGICLVGNFDQDEPTAKQMASLRALIGYLLKRCNLSASAVRTHQQINPIPTRCPGGRFPAKTFLQELKQAKK